MTTLTFHGHATFSIDTGDARLLIDPFLGENNPAATISADDVSPDAILVTHGHPDHIADCIPIAKRTGCLVVANFEICNWLEKHGLENVHPMHLGGGHKFDWGELKLTIAHHGSGLPDGSYGGNPAGLLITLPDAVIHHAGDTALFSDMSLLKPAGVDVAILPIGDNFTMGPSDAILAAGLIEPKAVVPCHYDTWPVIAQDVEAFAEALAAQYDGRIASKVLAVEESLSLPLETS